MNLNLYLPMTPCSAFARCYSKNKRKQAKCVWKFCLVIYMSAHKSQVIFMCLLNGSEGDSGTYRSSRSLENKHVDSAMWDADNHPEMRSADQILHFMFPFRVNSDFLKSLSTHLHKQQVQEQFHHIEKANPTKKRMKQIIFITI